MSNYYYNFELPEFMKKYGTDWEDFLDIMEDTIDHLFEKAYTLYNLNEINRMSDRIVRIWIDVLNVIYTDADSAVTKRKRLRSFAQKYVNKGLSVLYEAEIEDVTGITPTFTSGLNVGSMRWGTRVWGTQLWAGVPPYYVIIIDIGTSQPDLVTEVEDRLNEKTLKPAFYQLIIINESNPDNLYMLQGDIYTGITLDMQNATGGTLSGDFVKYDDINYDAGTYGVTAVYESGNIVNKYGLSELKSTGIGDVFFQWKETGESWSAEQDASGSKTFAISGTEIQYRFIFKSESWDDPDSIIVTEIS